MTGGRYISIPGTKTHELPPLLVQHPPGESVPELNSVLLEAEEMLPATGASESLVEQRKFDLAVQLTEQYRTLLLQWQWGDSVLEWIRQCEITFECEEALRNLLHPDVWPHASRASFVALLEEKHLAREVPLECAVGLRLTFRQPPPIDCCSNQFLLYLNSTVASSAYQTWARLVPEDLTLLPPDRFHFEIVDLDD
ncbi:MAG TPA: hypothetical protein VKV17_21700 [Bryobacteraceae bacterium]|nr:hypothetical protein [Bryobacteraceae bacterium]